MSMLAEPRQRKRYNLVPRGKALYEDTNRFGTKMLEKMGWSKDKGLGAREDGLKDFVRIRYKNDAEGFGYENRDDQWTEHEKQFSGLLNSLNNSADNSNSELLEDDIEPRTIGFGFQEKKKEPVKNTISGESLEEKSKNSKARVHYKKFTRGKDLTRYSEKDLANIFGKKKLNDSQSENTLEVFNEMTQNLNEPEKGQNKESLISGMNTFTSGTSVTDYFKQKMQKLKPLKLTETNAAIIKTGENSESSTENILNENSISKKKKSKKRKYSEDEEESIHNNVEEPTKKKKKTGVIENLESEVVVENSEEIVKKKKKKKKNDKEEIISELPLTTFDEEPVKTKKKKSKKEEIESNNVDENSKKTKKKDEVLVQYEDQEPIKKKSKKSKSKETEEIVENEQPPLDAETHKKKKKSRKEKSEIYETEKANEIEISDENSSKQQSSKELNSDVPIKKVKTKSITNEIEQEEEKSSDNSEEPAEIDVSLSNSYVISEFSAEKFRQTDLQGFCGSNISDILGYGINDSIELVIKHNVTDDKKIIDLWENATKTRNEVLNQKYDTPLHKYRAKMNEARRLKKKVPKMNVKQFQKTSVFNLNI